MVREVRRAHSSCMARRRSLRTTVMLCLTLTPTCAPGDLGGDRPAWRRGSDTAVACIDSLWPIDAERAVWTALPEPAATLDFRIYWNDVFQVFEIVFRNRAADDVTIHYAVGSPEAPLATALQRRLRAGETQAPPGETIRGAVTGHRACVRVRPT